MQNPVTTALWLVAACQIITPMFSFTKDCQLFCKAFNASETLITALYVLVVSLCCMLGPHTFFRGKGNFYDMPFGYRYKLYIVCVSGAVGYAVGLALTRKLLTRFANEHKIAPS